MNRPEHLLRIEMPDLGRLHRRESDSVMEPKDRELDEEETVLAPVAPWKQPYWISLEGVVSSTGQTYSLGAKRPHCLRCCATDSNVTAADGPDVYRRSRQGGMAK